MGDLKEFDQLDRRIIEMLCTSSQGSYRQLAKQLGVHPTTLIQRVKALEDKGVINGYRAKVDYVAMGYDYTGLVQVFSDNIEKVEKEIRDIPEVVAVYDVTGEADAIVVVTCLGRDEFSAVVKRINSLEGVNKTNTSVVLNIVKSSNEFVPPLMNTPNNG
ncbi:Transcriptional regulator [Thermoplasmatales archaeon BRNA1]|nr:Transcriptional regulator [Thermoplasmatales archaeon BRNA1]